MKSKIFVLGILLGIGLFSCKKEDTRYSDDINGSRTSYPYIVLNGSEIQSIPVGGTFTDPGFTATDSLYPNPVTSVTGEIDPNTPGMYVKVYTATNSKGLKSTASRLVAVTDMDDAFDISGEYKRGSSGVGNLVKEGRGIFSFDNCGGLPPGVYPAYFYVKLNFCFLDSNTIICPAQLTTNGTAYFRDAEVDYNTPTTIAWYLRSSGYGSTTQRVFIKQ